MINKPILNYKMNNKLKLNKFYTIANKITNYFLKFSNKIVVPNLSRKF